MDWLSVQIPFSKKWVSRSKTFDEPNPFDRKGTFIVPPEYLPMLPGSKKMEWVNGRWKPEEMYLPWEKVGSNFHTLAIKPNFEGNQFQNWPYLTLKCSPSKLLLGHNVYGPCCLSNAYQNMIFLLSTVYPSLFDPNHHHERGALLDLEWARLECTDLTKSLSVSLKDYRLAFIEYIRSVSKGHTKPSGDGFETTAYFGPKNSRNKNLKCYLKGPECLHDNEQRKRTNKPLISDEIMKLSEDKVRIEARLYRNFFESRGLPTRMIDLIKLVDQVPHIYNDLYAEATKDLFDAMEGDTMTILNDDTILAKIDKTHGDVRGRTQRVFGFYQAIKAVGLERYKKQLPKNSYYRQISQLKEAGVSHADLCNLHKPNNVVQIRSVINLNEMVNHMPADLKIRNLWELESA